MTIPPLPATAITALFLTKKQNCFFNKKKCCYITALACEAKQPCLETLGSVFHGVITARGQAFMLAEAHLADDLR